MRVLLLNPGDTPWSGDWKDRSWDLIVDLGFAGAECYRRWGQQLKTRIFSLFDLQQPLEIFRDVNRLIAVGRNRVVDSFGLDWWELQAAVSYQQFQLSILLSRLRAEIGRDAEVHASSSSQSVRAFAQLMGREIHVFGAGSSPVNRFGTLLRRAWRLTPSQTLEIAFDKWDSAYRVRRLGARSRRAHLTEPLVLLPSQYVNVSRAVLEYAKLLPQRRFLLAATRHSGTWRLPLKNLTCTSLAAYAEPDPERNRELESLVGRWRSLQSDFAASHPELISAGRTLWDGFVTALAPGLAVRDAWWRLLNAEPVAAVLCADDLNLGTRIPLFLAGLLGLRTLYCAHGALDASLIFKEPYADVFLARGQMEREFMAGCGIPAEKIVVGAAAANPPLLPDPDRDRNGSIVFFSQPYEIYGGRALEAYREILPALCDIAQKHKRKVLVKLHPFESRRERHSFVRAVLSPAQQRLVEIADARFAAELFPETWFGVSVNSSVAVECTIHGIPFFNCGWLEPKDCGYGEQFHRFGAGRLLQAPGQLHSIPDWIAALSPAEARDNIAQPIPPATLDQLMFGGAARVSMIPQSEPRSPAASRILRDVLYPSLAATRLLRRHRRGCPDTLAVLTYHGLFPPGYQSRDSFFDDALVEADVFRRQLRFLKENYSIVTPDDCRDWLRGSLRLPPRSVLVTCDDGLLNNLTVMLPILREENVKCLFFVTGYSLAENPKIPWYFRLFFLLMSAPSGFTRIDLDSSRVPLDLRSRKAREASWWRLTRELSKRDQDERDVFLDHIAIVAAVSPGRDFRYCQPPALKERYLPLSASDVRQLVASGMTVGGHTLSHPVLSWASAELSHKEILDGRKALQQTTELPVWALAYPFGDADSVGVREVGFAGNAGYECAFLNFGGCVDGAAKGNRLALPRLHVSASMQMSELEALVSGFDSSLRSWFARSGNHLITQA